jgi:spore germination protein KA
VKYRICFLSSIVDTDQISQHVVGSLLRGRGPESVEGVEIEKVTLMTHAIREIVNGAALYMADGAAEGYAFSAPRFKSRAVPLTQKEISIKGPNESFTENLNDNISILRKWIRNEKLIVEQVPANRLHTEAATLLYIKDVASDQLLADIRMRLIEIQADYIQNVEILEHLLDNRPFSLFPTLMYTEKPDRVVAHLAEGHIALLKGNSAGCLVLPATFWSLYHSADDHYMRFFNGNFARLIRFAGLFVTLFTSALYIAFTNFHQEMLPTDLLLAIAGTREKVPFPAMVELLLTEFFFELIREAGLRIPAPLGPTIGIVGALILGQAAVQANIISPIVIIIVALSGLASFTIANVGLNYTIRLIRFMLIIAAGTLGILGLALTFLCLMFYVSSIHSFGVPYLSPLTPHFRSTRDIIFRLPKKYERRRPENIKPKRKRI